ncbi:MAG: serine/threonine protein kinase [Cyanobacteria bacterium CRU_2_1]|nr:serine/threonine protein kinase [Cyanobacteria bacterium CRU_2_1]
MVQQRYCAACTMPLILDGRYVPLTRLGGGAFGTTFLGLDLRSAKERHCVIKQLQLKSNLTPSQVEGVKKAFQREAEILETLGDDHHQIPTLYAYFGLTAPAFFGSKPLTPQTNETEEFIYLVQEHVAGQDLDKELRQKGKLSETEVMEIWHQVLPILRFIHERGAIHRDIKPSNMMRDRNGRIYLIDFGAVKQVTTGISLQSNSLVFGTLGFAPPEQIAGKQVFPATDLYSLAVTTICLLTGKSPSALLDAGGDSWNWRPHTQVSDRFGQVLDKMLEFIPGKRFQSADAVMAILFQPQKASFELNHAVPGADVDRRNLRNLREIDETALVQSEDFQSLNSVNPANAETCLPPHFNSPKHPFGKQQVSLNPVLIERCREELAYLIGPIANLVIEEVLEDKAPASFQQLVDALTEEIPDPQAALEFRRKLFS